MAEKEMSISSSASLRYHLIVVSQAWIERLAEGDFIARWHCRIGRLEQMKPVPWQGPLSMF